MADRFLKWPRFSLRTLLLAVTLIGSGYGLHVRWGQTWGSVWVMDWSAYRYRNLGFSRDGSTIHAKRAEDGWQHYETESGELVEREAGTTSTGNELVWDPWRKKVKLRRPDTGRPVATLDLSTDAIHRAFASPDGKRVVTVDSGIKISVWDAKTGRRTFVLEGHQDRIESAAFSSDGARIVTASWDHTARVWDAETGALLAVINGGPDDYVWSPRFSPDGTRIVAIDDAIHATIWDARTGTRLATLTGKAFFTHFALFSPDSERILTNSRAGTAQLWRRLRPEWWWGQAWLPEFWVTLVLGGGLLWSVWRDRKIAADSS